MIILVCKHAYALLDFKKAKISLILTLSKVSSKLVKQLKPREVKSVVAWVCQAPLLSINDRFGVNSPGN